MKIHLSVLPAFACMALWHAIALTATLTLASTVVLLAGFLLAVRMTNRHRKQHENTATDTGTETDKAAIEPKEESVRTAGEVAQTETTKTEATETDGAGDDGQSLTARDARFLARLEEAVAGCIEDPTLNVDTLAALMKLGRSQLYNRIKVLTGMTPSDYLRTQRLKHAATLLEDPQLSIKEIHTRCGFNNSTKFYSHFRQEFGLTPGEYRKKITSDTRCNLQGTICHAAH